MPRAKFEVPSEMTGGVARAGYGLFKPGMRFSWPNNAKPGDNPSLKLIPVNEEATHLLFETAKFRMGSKGVTPQARAEAEQLCKQIAEVEHSGIKYHEWLAGKKAAEAEDILPEDQVPPEDKGQTDTPPPAPGDTTAVVEAQGPAPAAVVEQPDPPKDKDPSKDNKGNRRTRTSDAS